MEFRTTAAIRSAFLDYFEQHGHKVVPSASIVPIADDTLLFTNAGMVPFKQYFLNPEQTPFSCAVSAQRCLRVGGKHNDLDNVGYTARHHTFFEMLGNFSFGAYAKLQALQHAMAFLTEVLGLDRDRLWVTVYQDDKETEDLWLKEMKFPKERLVRCGAKDNFWSMGDTGPCGPCTEIFYDHGDSVAGGPPGSEDEDGDRYVEIWNIVFMQFDRQEDGTMNPLAQLCVDTGMGLERISAVLQGVSNNYDVDSFVRLINAVREVDKNQSISPTSARVIADHMRSITWMMAEGILPSNEGRGYVLRRIIRRALRYAYKSGLALPCLFTLVDAVAHEYRHEVMLTEKVTAIKEQLQQEERAFALTISQGLQLFDKLLPNAQAGKLAGEDVFKLYDTYGFPYDLVEDLAREHNLTVDKAGFDKAMEQQRTRSRKHKQFQMQASHDWAKTLKTSFCGYDGLNAKGSVIHIHGDTPSTRVSLGSQAAVVLDNTSFYAESGGQIGDQGILKSASGVFKVADTQRVHDAIVHWGEVIEGELQVGQVVTTEVCDRRYNTACNHSATHLLHAALRQLLGDHVVQKGSLVTPERLRFDFAHHAAISDEQIIQVEKLVNAHIAQAHDVVAKIMPFSEAKAQGVMALFTDKYQDEVRVLSMGSFSQELCGGIHVTNTAHIGMFVIVEETSVAQGVRRIEACTGELALAYFQLQRQRLMHVAKGLKSPVDALGEKVQHLQQQVTQQAKTLQLQADKLLLAQVPQLLASRTSLGNKGLLVVDVALDEQKQMRVLMDALVGQQRDTVVVLLSWFAPDKAVIAIGVGQEVISQFHAATLLRGLPQELGIRGGGKPSFAQGSFGCDQDAFARLRERIHAGLMSDMKF